MTTTIEARERTLWNALSDEEIGRRKTALRRYALAHPDLTLSETWKDRILNKLLKPYQGKVLRALYDVITNNSAFNQVPAENFRCLVSYVASKIRYGIERDGLPVPPLEDIKQEGMVGVLKAQKGYDKRYVATQHLAYVCKSIKGSIWRGLKDSFGIVRIPSDIIQIAVILHRYGFSAKEARNERGIKVYLGEYRDETIDRLAGLIRGENLGLDVVVNTPNASKEEREGMSAVHSDLKVFMSTLNERNQEVLLSHAEGQTLMQIGKRLHITRERVRQIEEKSLARLRRRMTSLLAFNDPHAIRLYREYFEK
ncbi:MAG TPA: sigma-70 family RNA polymerase sigma factor [Candidatus Nanoarchaeia archaeon]|nr:sigma-70 family RNA polymerase sigma factor [Candidatus Nanoarchaeia archaeon]